MQGFLSRVMAGRLHAVAWTAFTAIVALTLAPMSFLLGMHCISGALVALTTLRHGIGQGGLVMAGATVLTGVATLWWVHSPMPAVMLALGLWLPVSLMAAGLRATTAPGWVLTGAGAFIGVLVLGFRWAVGDPAAWWMEAWRVRILVSPEAGAEGAEGVGEALMPELAQVLEAWAPVTTGIVASGLLVLLTLTLFLARWGHALLDNPGGFGREFRALAVPRAVSLVTVALAATIVLAHGGLEAAATELIMITLVLHTVHGLAIAHSVVAQLRAARGWLALLYILLFLMPLSSFVAMALAMVGFSDGWVRYRKRVPTRSA